MNMKILNEYISRGVWLEAKGIVEVHRDNAFIFKGVKSTIKRNYLKLFKSKNKGNYKPEELFFN